MAGPGAAAGNGAAVRLVVSRCCSGEDIGLFPCPSMRDPILGGPD